MEILSCLAFVIIIAGYLQELTASVRILDIRVPDYVVRGTTVRLECLYDMDNEALYSVKWYKNGDEFYRYVPRDYPPAQSFQLAGIDVDLHDSTDELVVLKNLNLATSGRYRCEVSGEAPSFQTISKQSDMTVVSLPDQGPPKIVGTRSRYQVGDWINANCTSGRSKPAVELSWYVNDKPAEPRYLRKYNATVWGLEQLETLTLGLQFRIEAQHFRHSDMKLKCVASIASIYWRSNEESIEDDHPQKAPMLESRGAIYAENSRADPMQSMSYREMFVIKILSLFVQPNAASKSTDSILHLQRRNIYLFLLLPILVVCMQQMHLGAICNNGSAPFICTNGGIAVDSRSQQRHKHNQSHHSYSQIHHNTKTCNAAS